jgi:flagellar protein FliO/FliZ
VLELTVRLIVSLAVVVGLLLVLARVGARKFRGNSSALVHVVHRQPLSRTSAVAVVTVGSRVLVLGTTEHQVSVLAELDPDELDLGELELGELELGETELDGYDAVVEEGALAPVSKPPHLTALRTAGGSHRAAPKPADAQPAGRLAGSVLSAQTWRQAFGVLRRAS